MTDQTNFERHDPQREPSSSGGRVQSPRLPYNTPSLRCFGSVADITRYPGLQFGSDPLNTHLGSRSTS